MLDENMMADSKSGDAGSRNFRATPNPVTGLDPAARADGILTAVVLPSGPPVQEAVMQNTVKSTTDLHAVMSEAGYRLRFIVSTLERMQEEDLEAGGYDFAIVREVLEDVSDTLMQAAEEKGGV